jgi:hypothetical protein
MNFIKKTNQFILNIYKTHNKIILLLVSLIVLFYRRPGQFLYPYIWAEDGANILPDYLKDGFFSLFNPVAGYSILSSKIINFLSYFISFWYYPEVASFLANLFIIAVIFAIAYSPTNLKFPWLCAVLTLFVKTDPECFGTALYSFWWAGLLLVLSTLWRDKNSFKLQIIYIVLGGLSSPLIYLASPLLCVKAVIKKERNTIWAAIISIIPFLFQTYLLVKTSQGNSLFTGEVIQLFYFGIIKFFGKYVLFNSVSNILLFVIGSGLLCLLGLSVIYSVWIAYKKKNYQNNMALLTMFIWLGASIVFSIAREPVYNIHPYSWGPRYFFYPFILMSWHIVYLLMKIRDLSFEKICGSILGKIPPLVFLGGKFFVSGLLILLLFNFIFDGSLRKMSRDHYLINWRQELAAVYFSKDAYALPIHLSGNHTDYWYLNITASQCQIMLKNSLFPINTNFRNIWNELSNSHNKNEISMRILDGLNKIELTRWQGLGPDSFVWDDKLISIPSSWVIDYVNEREYTKIFMKINGRLYKTIDRMNSWDVADYFKNQYYDKVRFNFTFPINDLNIGRNDFSVVVILNDGVTYYESYVIKVFLDTNGIITIE